MGDLIADGIDSRIAYMGSIDGRTPYGDIIGTGPVEDFPDGVPQVMAADPDRHPTSKHEWLGIFYTSSSPVGHGFTDTNLADDFCLLHFRTEIGCADQGHRT